MFFYFCIKQTSKECVKYTSRALALNINIGDDKGGFERDNFFYAQYKSCEVDNNMFIDNLATNLYAKNASKD